MSGGNEACEGLQTVAIRAVLYSKQQVVIILDLYASGKSGLENRSLRGEKSI
jgi:hypothetical protein